MTLAISKGTRKHGRGRISPANLRQKKAFAWLQNAARLTTLPVVTAPSWDSSALGLVGPIKDQGQCGDCWLFSGVGVAEIAFNVAGVGGGAKTMVLSEQYVLDCKRTGSCSGDDNTTALNLALSDGLPLSVNYGPYEGGPEFCNKNPGALYKISSTGFLTPSDGVASTQDIKNAIAFFGSVGCAVAADGDFEDWGYTSPSFSSPFLGSGSQDLDHDVILYGWNTLPDGSTAWLMRNSWGEDWGVGGNMAIKEGANLIGYEAVFAQVVAPSPPPPVPPPSGQNTATIIVNGQTFTCNLSNPGPIGAIPPWLLNFIEVACAIGVVLPSPWNSYAQAICSIVPILSKKKSGCHCP